jgi:hypothetical protein
LSRFRLVFEVHAEFSALPGRDDRGGRMGAVEGGPAETLVELVVAVRVLSSTGSRRPRW